MYDVEIMDMEKTELAGYPHQGDYMEIGSKFEQLFIYAASNNLLNAQTRSISLYFGDPKSVPQEELQSMACISVTGDTEFSNNDRPEKASIPA
ncbi:MAG: AraC family transcriptional regulator [uncultured Thiotrichaceae bacterium]|uniref:AraC family transcriptional regulator n=1 Tax=uncultured Thiotrichaceae bacterium TaxID=298394 RepID=A0A6S6SXG3_9GAMM|nr:MAG: AraC family transcriptional regulator [uncultured Thiotrichaceae bacterium]